MSRLPYDVNTWVSTEGLIERLESEFEDFRPTTNEKLYLIDVLGRLVSAELAEVAVQCHSGRVSFPYLRRLIAKHLDVPSARPTARVVWAATLLVGYAAS